MMMSKYRNSTATLLVLAAIGSTSAAQEAPICDLSSPEFPCTINDTLFETSEDLLERAEEEGIDLNSVSELTIEGIGDPSSETADGDVAVNDDEATAETETENPEEATEMEAEAETEVEAEAAGEVETEAEAEAEAEIETETEAEPAEVAAEDETGDSDTVETEADDSAAAEPQAEDSTAATAEAEEVTAGTEEAAEPETETETAETEVESQSETDTEAEAEGNAAASDPEETLPDETPIAVEDTVEETTASAAMSDDTQASEVEEQTVADTDVRSASEDFQTGVTDQAASDDGDRGMTDFERALLIGLGALAIGSTLDNGEEVVSNSGDRVVLKQQDGSFRVLKDDDVLLRRPGSNVRVERFDDGSTRTFVTQEDGNEIVTIRSAEGRVLRRAVILPDGSQVELFNDTQPEQSVDVVTLRQDAPTPNEISMRATEEELRAALTAELGVELDRSFSLRQVRAIKDLRELAPLVELDNITFASGSAAIQPDQARELAQLGNAIRAIIAERPGDVFLIEGHTDAVGNASYNLALSDRRAETVALALTEYFDVPTANLVTQGYGETELKVRTLTAEAANRRASVRNITPLLR